MDPKLITEMMNNPKMMKTMEEMMNNPEIMNSAMNMLKNPNMQSMFSGLNIPEMEKAYKADLENNTSKENSTTEETQYVDDQKNISDSLKVNNEINNEINNEKDGVLYLEGDKVVLKDLKNEKYNNQEGIIERFILEKTRYEVLIISLKKSLAIKPENIVLKKDLESEVHDNDIECVD